MVKLVGMKPKAGRAEGHAGKAVVIGSGPWSERLAKSDGVWKAERLAYCRLPQLP